MGVEVDSQFKMTAADYLVYHGYRIGRRFYPLTGHELNLLALLYMKSDRLVQYPDAIEFMWPNPDRQPLGALDVIKAMVYRLRGRGFRIEVIFGQGMMMKKGEELAMTPPQCTPDLQAGGSGN
jgi:hypothetical protein